MAWFLCLGFIWTTGVIPIYYSTSPIIFAMLGDVSVVYVVSENFYTFSSCVMKDSVSSDSSRESAPSYPDGYNASARRYSRPSNAITELSQHFHQHSLTPQQINLVQECLSTSTARARDHTPAVQSNSSYSNRAHRQRQSLQRSSARLSHVSALVEKMVQTGLPTYHPTHPTSMLNDSSPSPSLSPDEEPPSAESYFGFTPLPSSSSTSAPGGNCPEQHSLRHSRSYKIEKEARCGASRDGAGGHRLVQKKVRMRKSEKNIAKGMEKRRE